MATAILAEMILGLDDTLLATSLNFIGFCASYGTERIFTLVFVLNLQHSLNAHNNGWVVYWFQVKGEMKA